MTGIETSRTALPRGARILTRFLDGLALVALLLIVPSLIAVWFLPSENVAVSTQTLDIPLTAEWLGLAERLGGLAITLPPALIVFYGVWRLRRFFRACLQGQPFTAPALAGFRAFALMILLTAILAPFFDAGVEAYLTHLSPEHERRLSFRLSTEIIGAVFTALVFFLVSHLLVVARQMQDEVDATI
jgi:hypothetical protein